MGVTNIIEKWEGRGASADEKGVRTLKRQWIVETNSDDTGEPEVIDALIAAVPSAALYASHPKWPWALRRKLNADPHNGPRTWLVNADYSTAPFEAKAGEEEEGGEEGAAEPPTPASSNETPADQRPNSISIARKEITKPLEFDAVTGVRIANTLGDPFDPPVEVSRSHQIITWKFFRKRKDLRWGERERYHDSINDAVFTILKNEYPAHTLRCIDYSFTTTWETGDEGMALFFEFTVAAEYNPDGWKVNVLNTGRRKMIGGSLGDPGNPPQLVAITDGDGQPVADPVPLDQFGAPVIPGGEYHYVEADGYVPRAWANLLQ